MRYETMSIDRRADYYQRSAPLIAADPLDFYCRAERGRKWQSEIYRGYEYARMEMLDSERTTGERQ